MKEYLIKDTIHGNIAISLIEKQVIDHPYFQRLRNISQLGMASMVYPTANHTRFEHSLGVMYVVSKMFDAVLSSCSLDFLELWFDDLATYLIKQYGFKFNDLEGRIAETIRQNLRLAALLHDVGHLPKSHSFEEGFQYFVSKQDKLKKYKTNHETVGHKIIEKHFSFLDQSNDSNLTISTKLIIDILSIEKHEWNQLDQRQNHVLCGLKDFVSGNVDGDRLDYVLRDAYYTVRSGSYDLERLISNLEIRKIHGCYRLVFKKKAISSLNGFFLFRYRLYQEVYHHAIINLYDIIFETFVDYKLTTLAKTNKRQIVDLCRKIIDGYLIDKKLKSTHSSLIFNNNLPLDDSTWMTSLALLIFDSTKTKPFVDPTAYINDPEILFKSFSDRNYKPISLWKDYPAFKKVILNPIEEYIKTKNPRFFDEQPLKIDEDQNDFNIILNQIQTLFLQNYPNFDRMKKYLLEQIAIRLFGTTKLKHKLSITITDIYQELKKNKIFIKNILLAKKKPIKYDPVPICTSENHQQHQPDANLEDLKSLSPFFDNIANQVQDKPPFFIYLHTDHDLEEIRKQISNAVKKFMVDKIKHEERIKLIVQNIKNSMKSP